MNHTTRTAVALAATAVALVTAYSTAQAAGHTLAPGPQRATVTSPADEHDPKEDVELDENGRPDLNED
jgi:Spy/CpxP family protein refolding chaperone